MSDRSQQVLFQEMILDLHYRLCLADAMFCDTAENFVSAAVLEDWEGRSRTIQGIREYSQALQLINVDFCQIIDGKDAAFPEELGGWVYDSADGELKIQNQLERLHVIAEGLDMVLKREYLHLESGK